MEQRRVCVIEEDGEKNQFTHTHTHTTHSRLMKLYLSVYHIIYILSIYHLFYLLLAVLGKVTFKSNALQYSLLSKKVTAISVFDT